MKTICKSHMQDLRKIFLALTLLILSALPIAAQGWISEHGLDTEHNDSTLAIELFNGNIAFCVTNDYTEASVIMLDPFGDSLWVQSFTSIYGYIFASDLIQYPDSSIIVSFQDGWNPAHSRIVRFSPNGTILWAKDYSGGIEKPRNLHVLPGGNILLTGMTQDPVMHYPVIFKMNAQGDSLFSDTLQTPYNRLYLGKTAMDYNGNLIFPGRDTWVDSFRVFVTDTNLNHIWTNQDTVGPSGLGWTFDAAACQSVEGDYFTVVRNGVIWADSSRWILQYDLNGTFKRKIPFSEGSSRGVPAIIPVSTGGVAVVENGGSNITLSKIDTSGAFSWTKILYQSGPTWGATGSLKETSDGGFLVSGWFYNPPLYNDKALVIKTDSEGRAFGCLVTGNIYQDNNSSCSLDAGDGVIGDGFVTEPTTGRIAVVQSDGSYWLPLDSGTYSLSYLPALPTLYQPICPAGGVQTISFSAVFDTLSQTNFGLELPFCPILQTRMAGIRLRPCATSYHDVRVNNIGRDTAFNARVEVFVPDSVIVTGASQPWASVSGNTYIFQLGNIPPQGGDTIRIFDSLPCNPGLTGRTFCFEAHAYPDSLCEPISTAWSGASLGLEGRCAVDDSIRFTIQNNGLSMSTSTSVLVLEDNLMRQQFPLILPSGADTVITIAGNGSTWTCQFDQVPNHPGRSAPLISVEGCGTNGMGGISTGIVSQFSQDDANFFEDIFCQVVVNSYDPNDKQAFPTGIGPEHLIENSTEIEYLIRFQNTGTDTAYRVMVLDVIDTSSLDIFSIRNMVTSHPYTFEIHNGNILRWVFNPINLPDSGANQLASNGYIQFRINQKPGNPGGTVIQNSADIYFDFNAPVLTNTVELKIDDDLWGTISIDEPLIQDQFQITAYPNPFQQELTFDWSDQSMRPTHIEIYNLSGQLVRRIETGFEDKIKVNCEPIPDGIYLFSISNGDLLLQTGKLVKFN